MQRTLLLSFTVLAGFGCASAPLAPDRLASSQAAIRSANEVGAGDLPQAELHVRLAQEELAQAKQLQKDGEDARAELFLQRSAADAELAIILAREEAAKAEAAKAKEALIALQGKSS
jgi:pyridoxal biosynthesis lyase PdxS